MPMPICEPQLHRIIRKAGLTPWPRLFHNLRATRQTELNEQFPAHVVCAWIGNTEKVAQNHYLQVTDDQRERLVRRDGHRPAVASSRIQSTCPPVRCRGHLGRAGARRGTNTDVYLSSYRFHWVLPTSCLLRPPPLDYR